MIAMIAIGIQKPGAVTTAVNHPSLVLGVTSALNIALSYGESNSTRNTMDTQWPLDPDTRGSQVWPNIASHNAFFNIIAELKDPKDFPKALSLLQCIDISLYLVCGVVIYRYAGEGVESPALGSAGPMVGKIAYGIALPTVRSIGKWLSSITYGPRQLTVSDPDCWCH